MSIGDETKVSVNEYISRRKPLRCNKAKDCKAPSCPHKEVHRWFSDCLRCECQRDQQVLPVHCEPVEERGND